MKVGETAKVRWYRFEEDDLYYSFHIAYQDKERQSPVVIIADYLTWPSIVAAKNNINYTFMRNADEKEVTEWLDINPQYILADVKEIVV